MQKDSLGSRNFITQKNKTEFQSGQQRGIISRNLNSQILKSKKAEESTSQYYYNQGWVARPFSQHRQQCGEGDQVSPYSSHHHSSSQQNPINNHQQPQQVYTRPYQVSPQIESKKEIRPDSATVSSSFSQDPLKQRVNNTHLDSTMMTSTTNMRSAMSPTQLTNRQFFEGQISANRQGFEKNSTKSLLDCKNNSNRGQSCYSGNLKVMQSENDHQNTKILQQTMYQPIIQQPQKYQQQYLSHPSSSQKGEVIHLTPQRNKSVAKQVVSLAHLDFEVGSLSHSSKHQQVSQYPTKNALLIKNKQLMIEESVSPKNSDSNQNNNKSHLNTNILTENLISKNYKQPTANNDNLGANNTTLNSSNRSGKDNKSSTGMPHLLNNFFSSKDKNKTFLGEDSPINQLSNRPSFCYQYNGLNKSSNYISHKFNQPNSNSNNNNNNNNNNSKESSSCESHQIFKESLNLEQKLKDFQQEARINREGSFSSKISKNFEQHTVESQSAFALTKEDSKQRFNDDKFDVIATKESNWESPNIRKLNTPPNSMGRIPNCVDTPQCNFMRGFSCKDFRQTHEKQDQQGGQGQISEKSSIQEETNIRQRLKSKVRALEFNNSSENKGYLDKDNDTLERTESSLAEEHSEDSILDIKIARSNFTVNPSQPRLPDQNLRDNFKYKCTNCSHEQSFKISKMLENYKIPSTRSIHQTSTILSQEIPSINLNVKEIQVGLDQSKKSSKNSYRKEGIVKNLQNQLNSSRDQSASYSTILLLNQKGQQNPHVDLGKLLGQQQGEILEQKNKIQHLESIIDNFSKKYSQAISENVSNKQSITTLTAENNRLLQNITHLLAIRLKIE